MADDTEIALGGDVMYAANCGYELLAKSDKSQGLEELLKEVLERWNKKRERRSILCLHLPPRKV